MNAHIGIRKLIIAICVAWIVYSGATDRLAATTASTATPGRTTTHDGERSFDSFDVRFGAIPVKVESDVVPADPRVEPIGVAKDSALTVASNRMVDVHNVAHRRGIHGASLYPAGSLVAADIRLQI